jgi:hypothetical protein
VHRGSELDLLLVHGSRRIGVEGKREDAPRITRSMRTVREGLRLERVIVVYPGTRRYALDEGIECLPMTQLRDFAG